MIKLRLANRDDTMLVFYWRNDPSIYENFRIAEKVGLVEHIGWFLRSLWSKECHIFIAEENDYPVGMIRLDERAGGDYEVSIIVDPREDGRGIGSHMLDFVCKCENGLLTAEIKKGNVRSRRIFEKCGFTQVGPESDYILYRRDRREAV